MTSGSIPARLSRRASPILFIGPALLVTLVLAIAPTIQLIRASTRAWKLGQPLSDAKDVGLLNFERLLTGSVPIGHSLKLTLIYTVSALAVELLLGLGIALLLDRAVSGARSFVMTVLLVPMILMPAMVGMIWKLYFSNEGLVNWFLGLVRIPPPNWYSTDFALAATIIVDIWQWTPFFILILLAGLQSMPREPLEAAEVDGASGPQILASIKLPLLLPLILIASTLRVMDLFRQFDVIFVMFAGGPGNSTETLPIAVYRTTIEQQKPGVGAAYSLILIAMMLLIAWLFISLLQRYRTEQ
ncbi:MAG: sugar ABC transporter permease [Thermomicrobiales bacterium]